MEISFAISYRRRRGMVGSKFEASFATIGLVVGGLIVTLIFLWQVFRLPLPF